MPEPAWPPLECRGRQFRWGERTYIMGILNVTPDSFYEGSRCPDPEEAARRARRMAEEGADLLDIGAESTRPGSEPISAEEELRRLLPALRAVRAAVDLPISVDTRKAVVAEAALAEGADLVNDVSGLHDDPDMARVVARFGCPVIVMHRRPHGFADYADLWADVVGQLQESIALAVRAGVPRHRIIVDPGFGFGKRPEHNLELLRGLGRLRTLGPVLIGPSRKSTVGIVLGGLPPEERLEGTLALVALAVAAGADIVRVHDVKEAVRAARMADAVVRPEYRLTPRAAGKGRTMEIRLQGMRFWARHGVLPGERESGQPFLVDLTVRYRWSGEDRLEAAVDYAALYRAVAEAVHGPEVQLLEALAARVAEAVLQADPRVEEAEAVVRKPHAPVGGPLGEASVRWVRAREEGEPFREGLHRTGE